MFAIADQDQRALLDALREVPKERNLELILCLADTANSALESLHGDGWRDALNVAVLAASVERVPGDAPDQP